MTNNCTITIETCKIIDLHINDEKNFARGKIIWYEGSLPEFKKNFSTFSKNVVETLKKYKQNGLSDSLKISGVFTKEEGTKDYAGRWYDKIIVKKLEIVNNVAKSFHEKEAPLLDDEYNF